MERPLLGARSNIILPAHGIAAVRTRAGTLSAGCLETPDLPGLNMTCGDARRSYLDLNAYGIGLGCRPLPSVLSQRAGDSGRGTPREHEYQDINKRIYAIAPRRTHGTSFHWHAT